MCGPRVRVVCSVGAGSFCLAIGIIALTFVPHYIDQEVLKRDYLGYDEVEGTDVLNEMTKQWMNPAYDMKFQIYLFNITNSHDILEGEKPKIQEIGPYTFIEKQVKNGPKFSNDSLRVIYKNTKTYVFNQTLSCPTCFLNSTVIIPNMVLQTLVELANRGTIYKAIIETVLSSFKETAFIPVTVSQALFEGYEDKIIKSVCSRPVIRSLCFGVKIPKRIGFFYGQNNTDDGEYNVLTGRGNPYNIGKVVSWNNLSVMPEDSWDSKYARMINGTDGQLFPPMINKEDILTLFAAQAGRSIWMEFQHVVSYRDVPAYRFAIPSSVFNGKLPQNQIFCNKDTPQIFNKSIQTPGCLPNGLIDVGRNQPGKPKVYLSQGHFFEADEVLRNSIVGLKPASSKKDITFVDIEPTTGVVIRARRSMQLNVAMLKGNLNVLQKTKDMILPVLWMNETVLFDDGTREQLKNQLLFAKRASFIAGVSFVLVGAITWVALAAVLLIFAINREQNAEESQPFVEEEEQVATEQH